MPTASYNKNEYAALKQKKEYEMTMLMKRELEENQMKKLT